MTATPPHAPASRGVLRLVRAGAWALAAMGLTSGAHLVGGGALPSPGAAALVMAVLLWSGLALTRWRLGRLALTVSLATAQLVLHTVLMAAEAPAAPAGTDCIMTGGHHVTMACSGAAPMSHGTSPTMLLAHAAAALLLALVLARGEDAVWFLAGLLLPRLPVAPALPLLPPLAPAPSQRDEAAPGAPVLGGVGRRGPPPGRAPAVA